MDSIADPKIAAAVKHYEAMRQAQQRYYDKKMGPKEGRRPRGRPKKVVAEGVPQEGRGVKTDGI